MWKIGEYIQLPTSKPANAESCSVGWNHLMDDLLGQIVQIEDSNPWSVKAGGWWWEHSWIEKADSRTAHRSVEMKNWHQTEQRMRERRDAQFRKIFGG